MWPDGKRYAVAFSFDFDAEEAAIGLDPSNADRRGPVSQGAYGARVAIPRILDILARHDVRATFFVPGRVAERHPERVREILAGGHEIGHHGYAHTSPTLLDDEAEERELARGKQVLEAFGAKVVGYRSPAWDIRGRTLELLERNGFRYSSNLMDDVVPYRHEGSSIVEVPVQWILDDAAHFWFDAASWTKKITSAREFREIWEEELHGLRDWGACAVFTMHPQVIGRPGRLRVLDDFIAAVREPGDAWIATCREVAATVP